MATPQAPSLLSRAIGWASSGSGYVGQVATAAVSWASSAGTRTVQLDPVDVLTNFAVLAYRDPGTKVHFDEHGKMGNDTPIMGVQAAKRYWNGSSSDQLYSCSVALYHAIHLLKPAGGADRIQPLFNAALLGVTKLRDTYAAEGDLSTAQLITRTHLVMLRARGEEEFDAEDYFVPDARKNVFMMKSIELWSEDDFEALKEVGDCFERAAKSRDTATIIEANIATARVIVERNFERLRAFKEESLSGGRSATASVVRAARGDSLPSTTLALQGGGGSGSGSTVASLATAVTAVATLPVRELEEGGGGAAVVAQRGDGSGSSPTVEALTGSLAVMQVTAATPSGGKEEEVASHDGAGSA